jgi:hypothetical protein
MCNTERLLHHASSLTKGVPKLITEKKITIKTTGVLLIDNNNNDNAVTYLLKKKKKKWRCFNNNVKRDI